MFVDSASHLQRPYGVREKSAAAILSVVKRFVAGMGSHARSALKTAPSIRTVC